MVNVKKKKAKHLKCNVQINQRVSFTCTCTTMCTILQMSIHGISETDKSDRTSSIQITNT